MTLVMRKCKPSPLLTEGDVTTKLNVYEDSDPMAQGYSLYSKATEEVTNRLAVIEARVKPQQKTPPSSKTILEGLFGEKQFLEEQEYAADVSVSKDQKQF